MASSKIKGLTVEIGGDTTKLGKALEAVNKQSKDLSSELGEINKLLKLDPGNADLLAQKQQVLADAVSNTKEKLDILKEAEAQVQEQFERGEVSEDQVRALQREIITTTKKVETYERAAQETAEAIEKLGDNSEEAGDDLADAKKGADKAADGFDDVGDSAEEAEDDIEDADKAADKAADSLDDMADKAEEAGDASDGLGSKLGGLAAGGLKALASGVTALVGALVASAEASREYRTEMGKLDTAFTTNGHSSEAAKETYRSLQGVLGETEQAVEAANHLAKLTDNEKDLQKWTDICTGVYATFGASIPVEGLTEAANETAKLGQLTGPLADALNWAGESEEEFQAKLDACSDEQERQTLIMETLNGLYGEAAEQYRETNAEVIRANEANEAWAASTAEVGGAIEPILTDVKLLGASLVSDLVPGVKELAEAFRGVLNGDAGAADQLGASLSGLVTGLLDKVTELVPTVAQVALSLITTLTSSLLGSLPSIVETLFTVAYEAVVALASYIPQLLPQVLQAALSIGELLIANVPALLSSLMAVVGSIAASLPELLGTLAERLPEVLSTLLYDVFPQILTMLTTQLPFLLTGIINILIESLPGVISALTTMIGDLTGQLVPQIVTLITTTLPVLIAALTSGLVAFLPVVLEAAVELLTAILDAVPVLIDSLIPLLPGIIDTILSALNDALPALLDAAIQLLFMVLDAIPVLIDSLIPALPVIIDTIITAVLDALPLLLNAAVQLLMAVVQAIPKILPPLIQQLPKIISTITGTLLKNIPLLISTAVQLFFSILEAIPKIQIELVKQIPSIIATIVKGLGQGVKNVAQVGKDLIRGLWNGISDMTSWILGKIRGFGDSVLSGIKSFFGIHSPSRVFRDEVGKMLGLGLAEGIEQSADAPLDAMADLSNELLGEAGSLNGLTLERRLQHTFAEPAGLTGVESGMLEKLDNILTAIERGQILTIDGKTWVGATADMTDSTLGQRRALVARGAV